MCFCFFFYVVVVVVVVVVFVGRRFVFPLICAFSGSVLIFQTVLR